MDEQLDDFANRIFAIISSKEKKKSIQIEFVGFVDHKEMKLFKDFIAVTLGVNQFKEDHIIDRAKTTIH